jgi:hypothetical protein
MTTATAQIRYGAHDQFPVNVLPVSPWSTLRKATARMTSPMESTTDPATPNRMYLPSPLSGSSVSCLT